MRLDIEHVTPTVAAGWLSKPWVRQRTISSAVVARYALAMAEGRWEEPSLDPIGFTVDGELGNGQHRLQAVIKAGWEGDMLIARDVPIENFLVMDTGRKRSAGQFVRLPNSSLITATARTVLWYDRVRPRPLGGGSATSFDNDIVLAFIDANEDALVEATKNADVCYRSAGIPSTVHAAVLFIARRDGADPDRIEDWVNGVATGVGLPEGDPRLRLREHFVRHPAKKSDRAHTWAIVTIAFNAYLHGQALARLQTGYNGAVPVVKTIGRYQKKATGARTVSAQKAGRATLSGVVSYTPPRET